MTIRNANNLNNQQKGKSLEKRFMNCLARNGYWVHFLHPAPDGSQPFDIIACKDNTVFAFDCKTLEGNRFPLSRVEDNQRTAFELMRKRGNYLTYFIIEVEENFIRVVPSISMEKAIKEGKKSLELEGFQSAYIGSK